MFYLRMQESKEQNGDSVDSAWRQIDQSVSIQ